MDDNLLTDLYHDLKGVPYCPRCANEAVEAGTLEVVDLDYEIEWTNIDDPPTICERCGRPDDYWSIDEVLADTDDDDYDYEGSKA